MTSTMHRADTDLVRAISRAVLVAAVRGRRARGGPWGEAVLAEFDQTTGRWEAIRWTAIIGWSRRTRGTGDSSRNPG